MAQASFEPGTSRSRVLDTSVVNNSANSYTKCRKWSMVQLPVAGCFVAWASSPKNFSTSLRTCNLSPRFALDVTSRSWNTIYFIVLKLFQNERLSFGKNVDCNRFFSTEAKFSPLTLLNGSLWNRHVPKIKVTNFISAHTLLHRIVDEGPIQRFSLPDIW